MKKISLIVMFVLLALNTMAQKNLLKGKITDKNQNPLTFASVILDGTVRGVQSDANGNYELKDFPKGDYQLKISLLGYEDSVLPFSITEAETKVLNLVLTEEPLWLDSFELHSSRGILGHGHLPEVDDYRINAGKKNEVIRIAELNANLAMNNSRQIFAKTPGITIWESDGSGIQLGVASRGLSPNRSWEFNVRMNGYDITPDPMGYPEAYFTPPMEVVEQIEIIRGASSLQFGPQFGGLMNFVLRKPDKSTRFTAETINTFGSNGLFSSFNYIGGTEGKWNYTAYYQKRIGNGWRENGYFNTDHAHMEVNYAASNRLKLGMEMTYMTAESQQPGGLTDAKFGEDSRQSTRNRNWFSTPWFVPSLSAEYLISSNTKLSWKAFGTLAERNSVGFMRPINVEDDLGNRQVDRDYYTTYGSELRLSSSYTFFGKENTLVTGLRYFNGHIDRKQLGVGTTGSNMDFSVAAGDYRRDLDFSNINLAAFAENIFRFSDKFLVTGGIRIENIRSIMEGKLNLVSGSPQLLDRITRTRSFALLGVGSEYHVTKGTEFYANFSQAYRPVLISDLTPPATTDVIDPSLKDSRGYNVDFGYRGTLLSYLQFDLSYFHLNYKDRIGTIAQTNSAGSIYQFRTNLGNSVSKGFEGYIEVDPITALFGSSRIGYLHFFASLAFIDATYGDFEVTSVSNGQITTRNLEGNQVENAPRKINRYGATYNLGKFSMTWQMSDIGKAYSDASNTETPNAAATVGLIPAYQVQDLSASWNLWKQHSLKAGVNNLTNETYFTRRAGGYPGPGIMPADGRTFYMTFALKF
ncbi:Fe(3+) dicitrate transport protein [Algoriphagus alkaliphilus]|uniref:Fe(3+) dicitrate transport protein n=1 Tax=Algoriphagus alkaliphilus TaxID=279824 RepID=A0A1G5VTE7_9BACT|nr:TonB-dependent receptor [Algoriphagus alkaliphilus]SDA48686.1 Fe(3+) dicitrate transport protein [Algoriphagus alkaliphilus]